MQRINRDGIALLFLKCMGLMYVFTALVLLLLTVLLYKYDIGERGINIGIIATYILAGLLGGFYMGKKKKTRKYLWGLLAGVLYFAAFTVMSLVFHHGLEESYAHFLLTLCLCTLSGMAGGMIS